MIPVSLHIPDSPHELVTWLEAHLLGTQLGELVAELQAVHGTTSSPRSLEDACAGRLDEILKSGLNSLPADRISLLMQQPELLLDLQDAVLQRGGRYWLEQPIPRDEQVALASQWRLLQSEFADPATSTASVTPSRNPRWIGRSMIAALLSAAATLAIVAFQNRPVPPASGWGWDRPGALAANLPPRDYLEHLATAAEDWFKKRPETGQDLARRISQFRQGCSTLILAEHSALPPADRDWLRERCRVWAGKLDDHLSAIESGGDLTEIRQAADETVNKLISAIRDRAKTVG